MTLFQVRTFTYFIYLTVIEECKIQQYANKEIYYYIKN